MTKHKESVPNSSSEYNKLVDHLVNSMKQSTDNIYSVPDNNPRKSFDELYNEYSAMSIPKQIENLKGLGRELFNKLDVIIDNLDVILEDKSDVDSNKQVD